MGRSLIHLLLTSILILALYVFGKTKHYFLLYNSNHIEIKEIKAQSADSIINQNDSVIIPVNYSGSIDFRMMNLEDRKQKFINYLLPAVVIIREKLLDELHHIEFIESKILENEVVNHNDSIFLSSIMEKYRTESITELKKRIYPHPVSLALTQAILESGWGTSSIARTGHNLFGVLSFSTDDSRLRLQLNDSRDSIYLRTYQDVLQSVEHYYLMISRVSSYKNFREKRWEGATVNQLLRLLDSYHENEEYVEMANSIMKNNKLTRFDFSSIDPAYKKKMISLSSFLTKQ